MKENKKKISLATCIKLLIIMIIIIGGICVSMNQRNKINETKEANIVKNQTNSENISVVAKDEKIEDFSKNLNTDVNKTYIDMTEENYKKYNNGEQTFRIQDVINNKNGTFTIQGRVYKYIHIPSTMTKEQYETLLNGGALGVLGEKVTKLQDDSKAKELGYDMALKIESKEHEQEMIYYVKKNQDGSGTLHNGSEAAIADGTDIYMKITLKENFICEKGKSLMALKKYFKTDYHVEDKNRTRLFLDNDHFTFNKGECVSIEFAER